MTRRVVAAAASGWLLAFGFWLLTFWAATGAQQGPPRADSPASQRPAASAPQTYDASVVQAGGALFAAQCGFCHGRDAMGGETGPDLTRSELVMEDENGRQLGAFLRVGRPDRGMPKFDLSASDYAHSENQVCASSAINCATAAPSFTITATAAPASHSPGAAHLK